MAHFMLSCNYSAESKSALIANPVDRSKAAAAAVEAVGGKLQQRLHGLWGYGYHRHLRGTGTPSRPRHWL